MTSAPLVAVVDDDESVRESLPDLLRQFGFVVDALASAEEYLESPALHRTGCLVLDVGMPGMSGPELQMELARRRHSIPIVFITAHADDDTCARVLAAGAVDCLSTPFSETALLTAVRTALLAA